MSEERIKFEDGQRRDFFIVGNDVMRNHGKNIGPYGIAIYCAVLLFANSDGSGAFPSIGTLAEVAGMSERQARAVLARLESEGLLRITRRVDGDGRRTTSSYTALGSPVKAPMLDGGVPAPHAGAPAGRAPTTRHHMPGVPAPRADNQDPHYQENTTSFDATASADVPASADAERGAREPKSKTAKPKAKADTDPRVTEVLKAYRDALGYSIPNGGREAAAAKWMLSQGYDCAQIMDAYRRMKAEPFWESRALSLQSVKGQIGEMTRRRSAITTSHTNTIPADVPPSWTFTDATGTVRLKAVSMVLADLGAHDADAMDPATWPDVVRAAYRAGIGGAP